MIFIIISLIHLCSNYWFVSANVAQLIALATTTELGLVRRAVVDIEKNLVNSRLKGVTVYYGPLARRIV